MNDVWVYTFASVIVISLLSVVGVLTVYMSVDNVKKVLVFFVSLSAGALLGDAFIHLLPEIIEERGFTLGVSLWALCGIVVFFVMEKYIYWHHCHEVECNVHHRPYAYMNLIGDALHNFLDGMIIAGSYMVSIPLGITTTIAVAAHEIPEELADFGVLLHGGFSKTKALVFNFLSALTSVVGAALVLIIGTSFTDISAILVPFTAGGFIYIAGSDLIPELHKENKLRTNTVQLTGIVLGIGIMVALLGFE
jgi:zinc and cadmium transporter